MAIEQERDNIYNEPIQDLVNTWVHTVSHKQKNNRPFSMFWTAGPQSKQQELLSYTAQQLNITQQATFTQEVSVEHGDLTRELEKFAEIAKHIPASRFLFIAHGFELFLNTVHDGYRLARVGHDWDQNVLEGASELPWGKPFVDMKKHVVVVTTIDSALGDEAYKKAVRSAVGSQFRDGIIEVKS